MAIYCPYCHFRFRKLAVNDRQLPDLAPIVCESCAQVGLYERRPDDRRGETRKLTPEELEQVKQSPAWKEFIEPALEIIEKERAKRS